MSGTSIYGYEPVNATQLRGIAVSAAIAATNSIYQLVGGVWTALTTLAGLTFTSPTLSTATLTGVTNTSGKIVETQASGPLAAFQTLVTGDAATRWSLFISGQQFWGDGTLATDVTLYRSAAKELTIDDTASGPAPLRLTNLKQTGASTTTVLYEGFVSGDTVRRYSVNGNGDVKWGAGGASGQDVRFYRSGVGELTIDNTSTGTGNLKFGNSTTNYVP
jgi:hypothetical protein